MEPITLLDGTENTHNFVRGSNSAYSKAIKMLADAKDIGIQTRVVMTVTKDTIDEIKDVALITKYYNALFCINFVRSASQVRGGVSASDFEPIEFLPLSIEDKKVVISKWYESVKNWMPKTDVEADLLRMKEIIYFHQTGLWHFPCMEGKDSAVILSDGSVSVCEMRAPFGHLPCVDFNYPILWLNNQHLRKAKTCYCQWDCPLCDSPKKSISGWLTMAKHYLSH